MDWIPSYVRSNEFQNCTLAFEKFGAVLQSIYNDKNAPELSIHTPFN